MWPSALHVCSFLQSIRKRNPRYAVLSFSNFRFAFGILTSRNQEPGSLPSQPSNQRLLQDPWIRHQHHPKFVHCSWPVGMVKRIFPLSSHEVDVLPCKRELISRLQANSASKCTIARVVNANPWPERKVPRVSDTVSSVLWAVFGFHPGLQKEMLHSNPSCSGVFLLCSCP